MAKESALEILRQKRDALQAKEAIATDASEKFKLEKEIQEVEEQIAKLAGGPHPAPGADLPTVVPQGLKSFDGDAKGFFLQLLPGPYHENGLPQSLHFWKRQIEQTDADETFRVGVIYGKSGCGKSSWIKAGLLPRLEGVTIAYVEAIPDGTPHRLLATLRKRCPWLEDAVSLAEALQRKDRIPPSTKVLIVLDQFEQWLHGRAEEDYGELLDALRQCNGTRVQCLLLIRSDFFDLLTRFLDQLHVRLEQGKNLAMFDLFDKRHARNVLTLFGRAYGAFSKSGDLTADQKRFLDLAVNELTDDTGRIVSVRLSLLAEMLKRREWTPTTLRQIGGTSGVGFAFLEENFSAKEAPRQYHRHEAAARAVLEQLLPAMGTEIKGAMQSEEELRSRSGYERRPSDFAELLQILNGEVRLITPTAPVEATIDEGLAPTDTQDVAPVGAKNYQLTHDYLVPSLRDWITAKHKATRRGRAQLRLDERSSAWNAKPENRNLPAWWEYLNIRWFTRTRDWTQSQRRMMGGAGRFHGMRWGAALLVMVFGTGVGRQYVIEQRVQRANDHVNAAINAPPDALPYTLTDIKTLPDYALQHLKDRFGDGSSVFTNDAFTQMQQLHGLCALAALGDVRIAELIGHVKREPFLPRAECENIVTALSFAAETLRDVRKAADGESHAELKARLALVALSLGDMKLASEMCQLGPDPAGRTALIGAFPAWHRNLAKLSGDIVRLELSSDSALLSALCLGVGSVPPPDRNAADFAAWKPLFEEWFQTNKNSGVHSAAGWAIRQWQIPEPTIPGRVSALAGSDWFVAKSPLTMIRISAGEFVRTDETDRKAKPQTVKLTRDLWLSDREVTVKLFREFADDKKYIEQHPDEALTDWNGEDRFQSSAPLLDHPVQQVSWEDAVKFCNWISRRESREVCYSLVKSGEDARGVWELNKAATGYRLPTEDEWEYACRAKTTTDYCFGIDKALLGDYAVFALNSESRTQPVGVKKPNGWGLFDMHGNVFEWCQDWYGEFGANELVVDSKGPELGSDRVYRGGSWFYSVRFCRSAFRSRIIPSYRNDDLGFRVALSSSGQESSPGSAQPSK